MQQLENRDAQKATITIEDKPLAVRPSYAQQEEIDTFDEFVQRFWRKQISEQEFQRFRLQHGVYGQRQEGVQMVRIKIPWGGLTVDTGMRILLGGVVTMAGILIVVGTMW